MGPSINPGDVIIIYNTGGPYQIGDILVWSIGTALRFFSSNFHVLDDQPIPIVHRVLDRHES